MDSLWQLGRLPHYLFIRYIYISMQQLNDYVIKITEVKSDQT